MRHSYLCAIAIPICLIRFEGERNVDMFSDVESAAQGWKRLLSSWRILNID